MPGTSRTTSTEAYVELNAKCAYGWTRRTGLYAAVSAYVLVRASSVEQTGVTVVAPECGALTGAGWQSGAVGAGHLDAIVSHARFSTSRSAIVVGDPEVYRWGCRSGRGQTVRSIGLGVR